MPAPSLAFGTGDWELAGFFTSTGQTPVYGTLFSGGGSTFGPGCVFIMQYGSEASPAPGRPSLKNRIAVGGFNVIGGGGFNVNGNPLLYADTASIVGTEYYIRVNVVSGMARLFINEVLQGTAMATANPWNFTTIGHNTWDGSASYMNGVLSGWAVKTANISTAPGAIPPSPKVAKYPMDTPTNAQMLDDVFNNGKSVVGNGNGSLGTGFRIVGAENRRLLQMICRQYGDRLPQLPHTTRFAGGGVWLWETVTTGSGRIAGKVTVENIPASRKVRLYRKHDGMLLRETWSKPTGEYEFNNIDPAWEYFVVAHDHLRVHNAVISDMIDPP